MTLLDVEYVAKLWDAETLSVSLSPTGPSYYESTRYVRANSIVKKKLAASTGIQQSNISLRVVYSREVRPIVIPFDSMVFVIVPINRSNR